MKKLSESHKRKIGATNKARAADRRDDHAVSIAVSMYQSGKTCAEIAKELGAGQTTIWRWLKASGIRILSSGDRMRGSKWSDARRAHHPEKPVRDPFFPRGYDILSQRAIGNKSKTGHGYVTVQTGRKQRQYEHILVAEKTIGRELKDGEVVHHINCDRTDNRPENLLICTIGYHLKLHARMRRHPYWCQFQ